MARNYKREYQLAKNRDKRKTLATTVSEDVAEDFKAKCSLDETTPNAILRAFIQSYVNNEITFDGKSIKAQK